MNIERAIIQPINKLADFLRVQCFGGMAAVSDPPVTHLPSPTLTFPPSPPPPLPSTQSMHSLKCKQQQLDLVLLVSAVIISSSYARK